MSEVAFPRYCSQAWYVVAVVQGMRMGARANEKNTADSEWNAAEINRPLVSIFMSMRST